MCVRGEEDGELRGGGRGGDLREARLSPLQLGGRTMQQGGGVSTHTHTLVHACCEHTHMVTYTHNKTVSIINHQVAQWCPSLETDPGPVSAQDRGYMLTSQRIVGNLTVLSCLCSYRTFMRPRYKVAHKMVTAMEWKCCHGYSGEDCSSGPIGGAGTQISTNRPQPKPGGHGGGGQGGGGQGGGAGYGQDGGDSGEWTLWNIHSGAFCSLAGPAHRSRSRLKSH